MNKKYSTVRTLIGVFFGQDFESFGETIEEIMQSYTEYENATAVTNLKAQISELLLITDDNELNTLMSSLAERQFEPTSWEKAGAPFY
ncbi:contact-dependent growth inhibition system immunity protein [Mangrovibacter sp. SLW1]